MSIPINVSYDGKNFNRLSSYFSMRVQEIQKRSNRDLSYGLHSDGFSGRVELEILTEATIPDQLFNALTNALMQAVIVAGE